ncbi:hypothetical protein QZJ86_09940 [Methylomonas montana]|uniref:hypothetical protein n=1 Tax=Methylomonas montana TaxID=3058963 RepID=UPI00265A4AEB|nr:hypothetical protein [Methylomonas montana]WKJ92443.1 hypothetical protein QZJ86_09940 [Methylomonas montana]
MKSARRQRGVGLIEALVAGLVFAVGIAAVIQLQGKFFKNSSSANARSIAMSIAQEKLEDLRAFQKVDSTDTTIVDFTGIGTNTGGRLTNPVLSATGFDTNSPPQPLKTLSIGNISFSRNWTVTDYYYNNGTLTTPVPGGTIPDQKRVVVTVTWSDVGDAADQTLALEGLINNNGPAALAALSHNSGGSGEKPTVYYSPSLDQDVVAVGVGSTTKRETLVPTADSSSQVKFTAYTYTSTGQLLRQEDFLTVSCNCAFTTSGQARTASYAKWEGNSYKDQAGDLVDKDKGCATNGNNGNCLSNPDEFCSVCCGDHHDPGASTVDGSDNKYCNPTASTDDVRDRCYDPFRGASDFSSGKHKHYSSSGTLASASGDQYLESCRMKRIDGFWRVYQDWHRVEISAFPLSELALVSGQTSTAETTYANYVKGIVDAILDDNTISKFYGQSFTLPTKPDVANRTASNPVSVSVGGQQTLTARAVYVDYLSPSVLTEIKAKKSANADYLIHVPFYEVDVTNRGPKCNAATQAAYGGWCPPNTHEVDVGAGDIADQNGNGLASGVIEGVSATTGSVNVTYSMRRSNSGLMGLSEPVDRANVDNSDILRGANSTTSPRDIAQVAVSVTTGAVSTTHTLSVTLSGGSPSSGTLSITPNSGTASCTGSGTSYSCTVPNSVAGSLSFSGLAGTDTCTGSSSYSDSSTNQSVTLPISCAAAGTLHTLTVTLTGGTPLTGTFSSDLASNCNGSGTSYTCSESNTATGTATWSYSGATSSGSSCSGTGTYATSTTAQSISVAISCVATRTLNVCLTGDNFTAGTLQATPASGGSQTTCSTPSGNCGSGNSAGKSSNCTVPSGAGGTLSFTGNTNSQTCDGPTSPASAYTYGVNDTTFSMSIDCHN